MPIGKNRADQHVLPDDPAFLPGVDLEALEDVLGPRTPRRNVGDDEFRLATESHTGAYSPQSIRSVGSARSYFGGSVAGVPTSSTIGDPVHDYQLPGPDEAPFEDVGFEFDEDGTARDVEPARARRGTSVTRDRDNDLFGPRRQRRARTENLESDTAAQREVEAEHAEAFDRHMEVFLPCRISV